MPENSTTLDHVMTLEKERLDCMQSSNTERLRELLYPNFMFTHMNAMTEQRQPFLERLESGEAHYHGAEVSEVIVEQYGSCVIINGLMNIKVDVRSQNTTVTLNNRFSTTWVKEGDTWRAAAYQSTPIPAG